MSFVMNATHVVQPKPTAKTLVKDAVTVPLPQCDTAIPSNEAAVTSEYPVEAQQTSRQSKQ